MKKYVEERNEEVILMKMMKMKYKCIEEESERYE